VRRKEGRKEGRKKGRKEGRKEGRKKERKKDFKLKGPILSYGITHILLNRIITTDNSPGDY
jgi:predicted transposase YdaD